MENILTIVTAIDLDCVVHIRYNDKEIALKRGINTDGEIVEMPIICKCFDSLSSCLMIDIDDGIWFYTYCDPLNKNNENEYKDNLPIKLDIKKEIVTCSLSNNINFLDSESNLYTVISSNIRNKDLLATADKRSIKQTVVCHENGNWRWISKLYCRSIENTLDKIGYILEDTKDGVNRKPIPLAMTYSPHDSDPILVNCYGELLTVAEFGIVKLSDMPFVKDFVPPFYFIDTKNDLFHLEYQQNAPDDQLYKAVHLDFFGKIKSLRGTSSTVFINMTDQAFLIPKSLEDQKCLTFDDYSSAIPIFQDVMVNQFSRSYYQEHNKLDAHVHIKSAR